ncbi:IS5 family transposase [Nocardia terpenica]|nr:IS5 family transposase [Nocardia terpenica]MBF6066379.1 IS5 family transposase [Nocardia terpenica]MBF6109431.1 IS5 family transposase [Nocardia terpenica]MBF6116626.1 IS5 family transposase [Nocardia terpenica]MBF6123861.1 IS5 family transposase [Nocardia terpenica]MBF6157209.1 IS5 family transposase [Nocardia terpenica]
MGRRPRYPSDCTDAEWALLQPLLPAAGSSTGRGGRPEKHDRRAIVDAIRYIVDNGIKWRALPTDYPPFQTVFGFFTRWTRAGVLGHIRDQLRARIRADMGRPPGAVAVVIDSQSVKGAETVGKSTRGYDAGKKINGRKRHLAVDSKGLPVLIRVTPASTTDRDGARELLWRLRIMHPELVQVWADSAYGGSLVEWAERFLRIKVKVVKKLPGQNKFVVLPRRWVVERTFSWLLNARRNARDYETRPDHSEAHLTWAAITFMTRRLTRITPARRRIPKAA